MVTSQPSTKSENDQLNANLLVAIGLELPPSIAVEIAPFRARYDPNFYASLPNGGAHITLKRPDTPLFPPDEVIERLRQVVTGTPAPRLQVGGVTIYHSPGGTSTIYLRVLPNPLLFQLHHLIQAGLEDYLAMRADFEGRYFIPHVTLANWLPDYKVGTALRDLREMGLLDFQRSFCCNELSFAVCETGAAFRDWQRQATLIIGSTDHFLDSPTIK